MHIAATFEIIASLTPGPCPGEHAASWRTRGGHAGPRVAEVVQPLLRRYACGGSRCAGLFPSGSRESSSGSIVEVIC